MVLIKKAMDLCARSGTPLLKTADESDVLWMQITNMGLIDPDILCTVFLLTLLTGEYDLIQSQLMSMANDLSIFSATILRCFAQEDGLSCRCDDLHPDAAFAFAAQSQRKPCLTCTHHKRTAHLADFCIQPGGKMAGCFLNDAKAAQRAATGKIPCSDSEVKSSTSSANTAMTNQKTSFVSTQNNPDSITGWYHLLSSCHYSWCPFYGLCRMSSTCSHQGTKL